MLPKQFIASSSYFSNIFLAKVIFYMCNDLTVCFSSWGSNRLHWVLYFKIHFLPHFCLAQASCNNDWMIDYWLFSIWLLYLNLQLLKLISLTFLWGSPGDKRIQHEPGESPWNFCSHALHLQTTPNTKSKIQTPNCSCSVVQLFLNLESIIWIISTHPDHLISQFTVVSYQKTQLYLHYKIDMNMFRFWSMWSLFMGY